MFAYNSQQNSSNVSSHNVQGFTNIEKSFSSSAHFSDMSGFVPYNSYSKISKSMSTLGK